MLLLKVVSGHTLGNIICSNIESAIILPFLPFDSFVDGILSVFHLNIGSHTKSSLILLANSTFTIFMTTHFLS